MPMSGYDLSVVVSEMVPLMVLFPLIYFREGREGRGHRRKVLSSFMIIVIQLTRLDYLVVLFLLGHPVINKMHMHLGVL